MEAMAEVFSHALMAGMDPLDLWQAMMKLGVVGKETAPEPIADQFFFIAGNALDEAGCSLSRC